MLKLTPWKRLRQDIYSKDIDVCVCGMCPEKECVMLYNPSVCQYTVTV